MIEGIEGLFVRLIKNMFSRIISLCTLFELGIRVCIHDDDLFYVHYSMIHSCPYFFVKQQNFKNRELHR